jgi:tetratricopeptide (TPR) repeat protein
MRPSLCLLPLLVLLAAGCHDSPPPISPKDRAEGYYMKGTADYLQGRFEDALASFEEMKQLSPDDPRLPAAFGEVYLSMGRYADSAEQFELALKRDPKRSTNWSRLGFIQAQLGKHDEAQSSLRKAVALNARDFNALEQLAEIHLKKGEKEAAVRHFALAATVSPDALRSPLLMRGVDVLTGEGRHDEALVLLEKFAAEGVRTPEVLSALGDEQVRAGKLASAAATYREAAGKSPRDPSLWELVGEISLRLDKPGDALAAFRESLRVKDRAVVHVAIARIHLARGDRVAAQQELDLALESVSGSDIRELLELADLLGIMDRKQDALRILSNLSAEPDHAHDVELQLRTARLAREMKDAETVRAACARVTGLDAGVKVERCP